MEIIITIPLNSNETFAIHILFTNILGNCLRRAGRNEIIL